VWPWRCGLMARPVSGVEWSGRGPQRAIQFHPCRLTLHISLDRTKAGRTLDEFVAHRLAITTTSSVCSFKKFFRLLIACVSSVVESCSKSTVGQAGPTRRQKRVLACTARTQISPPGENRYTGMAGQDDKFGKGASGSSTPGSAEQGNQVGEAVPRI